MDNKYYKDFFFKIYNYRKIGYMYIDVMYKIKRVL